MALYYRALRENESNIIYPVQKGNYTSVDLVYSNCMPSHISFPDNRMVWSFAKTPEAAMEWLGKRGKGSYNRLAVYDFLGEEGELYDLTLVKTWVGLIHNANSEVIYNLNSTHKIPIDAIRSIIPCNKSALSMSRACEEIAFIPYKKIELTVIDDLTKLPFSKNENSIVTELPYDNNTIGILLNQLQGYPIRRKAIVEDSLNELKNIA